MRFHASCAARSHLGTLQGVLLCGPSGAGKSALLLRLLHRGFTLVADDQVLVQAGAASAPAALAGLIEVWGLGLFHLPHLASAPLALVVNLGPATARLPHPATHTGLLLPMITLDPAAAAAPERLMLALDCLAGSAANLAGAFAA